MAFGGGIALCGAQPLAHLTDNASDSTDRKQSKADIVIYGGTSGGFTAAIQAARQHKKVVLLEPTRHIGGIVTNGLGGTDIDNHPGFQNSLAVGGLALEFYRRIAKRYDRLESFEHAVAHRKKDRTLWRFEPHIAETVLLEWLAEYPIELRFKTLLLEELQAVEKSEGRITAIHTTTGKYSGKVFIDATIEGDLIAAAGISTRIGREPNALYGEKRNGIMGYTTHSQFKVAVDPYVVPSNKESGLIPTIRPEPLGTPGLGDKNIQAYCFRPCLTQDPENKIPFKKPAAYQRDQYEIYLRYLSAGGKLFRPWKSLPGGKSDLNGGGDLSHNLYGMNDAYPGGSYAIRKEVMQFHKDFTQGLLYFLSHDPEVKKLDPELQKQWASWGLAKDEFTDNDNWPEQFYVRDARRMVSDYVITEANAQKGADKDADDPVAMAFWPPDLHNVRRIVIKGEAYNEGAVFGGDWWKPFGISYRALVPKRPECLNLLTPTCPSSSHIAYGAIRIEWTFMALGQAVGSAAAWAIEHHKSVQQVDYKALSTRLIADHQILTL